MTQAQATPGLMSGILQIDQESLHELCTLIKSVHPLVVVDSVEEERVIEYVKAAASALHLPLWQWSAASGLAQTAMAPAAGGKIAPAPGYRPTAKLDQEATPQELLAHLATLGTGIFLLKDLAPLLDSPVQVRALREALQGFAKSGATVVLSGIKVNLPPEIEHSAVHFRVKLPSRRDLHRLIEAVYQTYSSTPGVAFQMRQEDWARLIDALSGMTMHQARQTLAYCILVDHRLCADDIKTVITRKAQMIKDSGLLEYYPLGDNQCELGGLNGLKAWVNRAKLGYSEHARKFKLQPPRGIMIVGVQGCGKSLAAKVLSRELNMPLLKLDAGRLYDKYVGETEANFRRATAMAESLAPCVLWIDEIEKGFAQSGSDGEGATGRRIFGAFLTWLQEKDPRIFVAATANDLLSLPAELQRKGRFDEIFFVDLPTAAERGEILLIHLKSRGIDPSTVRVDQVVAATDGFVGAEIEQVVISGLYQALQAGKPLDTATLVAEAGRTVPLSVARAEDIETMRETFRGRFVPAA